jgi:hypothetical protein
MAETGDLLDWAEIAAVGADGELLASAPRVWTSQGGFSSDPSQDADCLRKMVARPSALFGESFRVTGQLYDTPDDPSGHIITAVGLGFDKWGESAERRGNAKTTAVSVVATVAQADAAFADIYRALRNGTAMAGEVRDTRSREGGGFRVTLWTDNELGPELVASLPPDAYVGTKCAGEDSAR